MRGLHKGSLRSPSGRTLNNIMYTCPYCTSRFKSPFTKGYPRNVAWYKYQGVKPVCPSCGEFLKDTWQTKRNRNEMIICLILFVASELMRPSPYSTYVALLVFSYAVIRNLIVYRKYKKSGQRYIKIGQVWRFKIIHAEIPPIKWMANPKRGAAAPQFETTKSWMNKFIQLFFICADYHCVKSENLYCELAAPVF